MPSDEEIINQLKAIREDLNYIKEHMVDVDMVLAPEEEKILEQARREFERGECKSLEDLLRERGED